ncbi:hypothetical protein ANO11243_026310 [Dothideomycetidae sp. 11243]|nr:hypothetical protein ANO11243_026310 [fungal sp. No.11243]
MAIATAFKPPLYRYVPPRRKRWPPSPSVEDEATALQKEFGPTHHRRDDGVLERGTIDQDPILIDLTPSAVAHTLTRDRPRASAGVPTPPASDDEMASRGRRHGPRLDTGQLDAGLLPEMMRGPSPYHFSKSQPPITNRSADGRRLDPMTPPPSASGVVKPLHYPTPEGPARPRDARPAKVFTTANTANTARFNAAGKASSEAIDDDVLNEVEKERMRSQIKSTRVSFSSNTIPTEPPKPASYQSIARNVPQRPLLSDDNRRHTDSWMEVPREQAIDGARKPAPLMVGSLARGGPSQQPALAPNRMLADKVPSRSSPRASGEVMARYPPSPPRSPRASLDTPIDPSSRAKRRSLQASAEGSKANSPRDSTETDNRLPTTAIAWQTAFDTNDARSPRPPPRLVTTNRAESFQEMSRSSAKDFLPPRRVDTLPYPVDDSPAAMPEERDHQFFPDSQNPLQPSTMIAKTLSRVGTHPGNSTSESIRPGVSKVHSFSEKAPSPLATLHTPRQSRQVSSTGSEKRTPNNTPDSFAAAPLPPCPRPKYVSGHSDWYTLEGCPNFDVCPSCLESVFTPTFYSGFFQQVPTKARAPDAKIRCDFSSPWMRIAWLLTLQRQMPNLNLLKELYRHFESSQPCPEAVAQPRQWLTILDETTRRPMEDFHICATDIRAIEILMPLLRGFWVPHPRSQTSAGSLATESSRLCSMRTTHNNRFPVYLDSLISLHEAVQPSSPNHVPDMIPFVRLVKRKLALGDCPRDNILQAERWYYIPALPELTVCQDCHDEVISPLLRADADLAMRFNRSPQYIPSTGGSARDSASSFKDVAKAASCALYSQRMRRHFRRAVADNDFKYLSRKAKDRKRKETDLQREAQPLISKMTEIDELVRSQQGRAGSERYVARLEEDRERLADALERCRDEWLDWE